MENILISLPLKDFERIQKDWIREVLDERQGNAQPAAGKYLTRQETAELLKITLPTLHDWIKRGIIKAHKIGGAVRFKMEEVERALQEMPSVKYKRR